MNELTLFENILPSNLEEQIQFIKIGREKLVAFQAALRASKKINIKDATDTHLRLLKEAQQLAEDVLDTEVIVGGICKEMEKGINRYSTDSGVVPKHKKLEEFNINPKQAERFEMLASWPAIIEQVKIEARENDDLVTRSDALKKIKEQRQTLDWPQEEIELLQKVTAGETVLINMYKHLKLLEYAQQQGIYVRIDRATEWGNPFKVDEDGTREEVCYWFEHYYFPYKKGLHKKIEQLAGKVLGCHCYPEKCHGETLIKFIEDESFDFLNC